MATYRITITSCSGSKRSTVSSTLSPTSSAPMDSPPLSQISSLALNVNSSGVRRLVQTFLRTCVSFPALDAEPTGRKEAQIAAPAELSMCLHWGLARVFHVSGGNTIRGFISWDIYVEWSEAEVGLSRDPFR
ncbi:hypothetical protein BC826DRAFT_969204 [Russula brevipes]|nr:hypothetical protein BC826DRAFT_969204 [Russula brevipes]